MSPTFSPRKVSEALPSARRREVGVAARGPSEWPLRGASSVGESSAVSLHVPHSAAFETRTTLLLPACYDVFIDYINNRKEGGVGRVCRI